ncbi:protein TOO MANY MOUTHS-like [Dorcoceras hygrometricum]|uniref:Protein TOO MANY MOUTHS-like n=1 Tax=Dorcoceras hygrometricum TaxID=472368 RepID=A0A2Z7D6Q5_9LAMI|nr:protein TOO MANY MOUTHS-like [Dorcoceras hygrometricum]
MQCHADRGFLPKSQSDLYPSIHVSLYQQWEYDVTWIMVFFRIGDFTSGPDLSHIQSYTSILRLGLAAGETPDVPYYHLGTRRPSSILQARPTLLRSGNRPRTRSKIGICPRLTDQFGSASRGQCLDVMKSPTWIRLSLCR